MKVLKKIKDYVNFENQDSKATFEVDVSQEIQHYDRYRDRDDEIILDLDVIDDDVVEGAEEDEALALEFGTAEELRNEQVKKMLEEKEEKARLEEENERIRK